MIATERAFHSLGSPLCFFSSLLHTTGTSSLVANDRRDRARKELGDVVIGRSLVRPEFYAARRQIPRTSGKIQTRSSGNSSTNSTTAATVGVRRQNRKEENERVEEEEEREKRREERRNPSFS